MKRCLGCENKSQQVSLFATARSPEPLTVDQERSRDTKIRLNIMGMEEHNKKEQQWSIALMFRNSALVRRGEESFFYFAKEKSTRVSSIY